MEYPAITISSAAQEVNRLHQEISGKLRGAVDDAIRIGEILSQVKDRVPHGDFLPWLKTNCTFSDKTAEKYMHLHKHASKIEASSNLQEAYKVVEQIETSEKQTENQRAKERVYEYRKTGVKPEGWRRGTDDKLVADEEQRERDIEKTKERLRLENEKKQRSTENVWVGMDEDLEAATKELVKATAKRQEFKKRIKLSQAGESDAFIDALMDYLDELEDDNRRIEACQNIIKVCKNIAAQLQIT